MSVRWYYYYSIFSAFDDTTLWILAGNWKWRVYAPSCEPTHWNHLKWWAQCTQWRTGVQCCHVLGEVQYPRAKETSTLGRYLTLLIYTTFMKSITNNSYLNRKLYCFTSYHSTTEVKWNGLVYVLFHFTHIKCTWIQWPWCRVIWLLWSKLAPKH